MRQGTRDKGQGTGKLRIADCELWIKTPKALTIRNPKSEIRNANNPESKIDPLSSVPCPSLGVIVSQFPEMHETFVVRELQSLVEAGIPLRIYSLKRCRDRIVHPQARALMSQTQYVAWDDAGLTLEALREFSRHPFRGLETFLWTLEHHFYPPIGMVKALIVWAQAIVLAKHMRADGITHIHAHWATMPTTAALLCARWLNLSFSFTAHAWDIFVRNPSLKEKVRLAARVMTCTDYNRRFLQHLCPDQREKIVLNYHGVDLERFASLRVSELAGFRVSGFSCLNPKPANSLTPLLLSVGRLVETKGFETLIDAYRTLRDRKAKFHAVIVGAGPLERRLARRIEELGLSEYVSLRPALSQGALRTLYEQAFAFVLPSIVARNGDRDGIPNVILEAMAMGLPVVSTSISGIPEAVQDQRTGLLVVPRDSIQLADALTLLLERPSFARVLGDHGRMWAEVEFDARIHMRRLVGQMRELLTNRVSELAGSRVRALARLRVSGFARLGFKHANTLTRKRANLPTREPITVMYVIWSLEVGGAERVVIALASGLDRKRFSPMVVCLNQEGRMASALKRQGITVIALNKRPGIDLGMLAQLIGLMKQHQVSVVHAHLWGANLWARIAAVIARAPIVIAHEHGMQPWRGSWHFRIDRWLSRWTSRILFASLEVMQRYCAKTGIAQERCLWVLNGVVCGQENFDRTTLRTQLGFSDEDRVIISVGRLSPEKGHEDLLLAFAKLRQHMDRVRLVLVGDGTERDTLKELQRRCRLNGEVTFAGTQDDVRPWLVAADVYVQPSRREGLALAVLEAMALGLPVIATHVGDMARVITDGVTGYLVPAQAPEVLSTKLQQVISQLDKQQPLGEAARALVQRDYSERRMVATVEKVYEEEIVRCSRVSELAC